MDDANRSPSPGRERLMSTESVFKGNPEKSLSSCIYVFVHAFVVLESGGGTFTQFHSQFLDA